MRIALASLGAFAALAAAADAKGPLDDWAGVYKYSFDNGNVEGAKYKSEDILEIVAIDSEHAYVRADLAFYNGHSCAFYGVARLQSDKLVYSGPANGEQGDHCVMTFSRGASKKGVDSILFSDAESRCQAYTCGARGTYEGTNFPISSRRDIRYLPRLRNSQQYKDALREAGITP